MNEEQNMYTEESAPVVPPVADPVAQMVALLEQQTALLQRLVEDQDEIRHREKLRDIWGKVKFGFGFVKHAVWIGLLLWLMWEAKMFFENMFDAITPDFSAQADWLGNAKDNVADTTSGWVDNVKGLFE